MLTTFAYIITSGGLVSWNWNGSAPGGQVAEKKSEGEVAIQSKRGNTIKKDAKPGDPAIHLERPGNDVVKNQSELQVDEKNAGGDDSKQGDKSAETNGTNGNKRKAEDEPEADGGDDKAPPSTKKAKAEKAKPTEKKEKATPKKKDEKPKAADKNGADGEKKARGRPKGSGAGEKKAKKSPAPPTGVGKRTRSNK